MFWGSLPQMHAALNDLPAALFVAGVIFEVLGYVTKRESLTSAGFWALVGAAIGGVLSVWSGLRAEDVIEHGSVMHRSIERHQTLAISFTILAGAMTGWRIFQRGPLTSRAFKQYLVLASLGTVALLWTAKVGGRIVFNHAGGLETRILESSLAERTAGHAHEADAADHDDAAADSTARTTENVAEAEPHEHDN